MKTTIVKNRWKRLLPAAAIVVFLSNLCTTEAQLTNGDFEASCGGTIDEAFQQHLPNPPNPSVDCVDGPWQVSHGTPDIYTNIFSNATASVRLFHRDNTYAEGIFIECPDFLAGHTYRVTYRILTENVDAQVRISLASGLTHRDNIRDWVPQTGITEVNVRTYLPAATNTWYSDNFTFTPSTNFSQLYFYVHSPSSSMTSRHIYLDDIAITEIITCPANVTYPAFSGTPAFTEASDYIYAYGTSTVTGIQQVTYKAGDHVRLGPDFHAKPTGTGYFHSYIAPCGVSEVNIQPCDNEGLGKDGSLSFSVEHLSGPALDNYPNPFTGETQVSYIVEEQGPVSLTVVNMLGVQVAELVNSNNHGVGWFNIEFNSAGLPPGVYYLRLTKGTTQIVKKMMISP